MILAIVRAPVADVPFVSEALCVGMVGAWTLNRSIDADLGLFAVVPLTCRG